jgi:hypothetical protein
VIWDRGCYLPLAVDFVEHSNMEAMDGERQTVDASKEYKELQRCTIVESKTKLDSLLGPKWR